MKSYNEYLSMVNDAIRAIDYPKQPAQLYEPIIYTMNLGGKRVRPVLTLMACEALGGDPTKALEAAVGIELFHNFTLLHDDVMDHADVRRGKPTVHRRWNDNVAILCGDAMFTLATQHVQRVDDRHLPQAMLMPVTPTDRPSMIWRCIWDLHSNCRMTCSMFGATPQPLARKWEVIS